MMNKEKSVNKYTPTVHSARYIKGNVYLSQKTRRCEKQSFSGAWDHFHSPEDIIKHTGAIFLSLQREVFFVELKKPFSHVH
jgi:hypothetical protein